MAIPGNHKEPQDLHVAIIMDGNGRWATRQGKPRFMGHQAGAERVREIVKVAPEYHISTLTLFAFSSDNWQRPTSEVEFLMRLFHSHLLSEIGECADNGIRLQFIGRRDRLNPALVTLMRQAEAKTAKGENLLLRAAVDYSSREAILQAAQRIRPNQPVSKKQFSRLLYGADPLYAAPADVDLLIRTGGEQRLSDFLLWECAYAELYFTHTFWPDFDKAALQKAMEEFHRRERRFGRVLQTIQT